MSRAFQRTSGALVAGYVAFAWFWGGATVDVTSADEWLMILAWFPLLAAVWIFVHDWPRSSIMRVGLVTACLVPMVIAVQLVTFPLSVLHLSSARLDLDRDLIAAGIQPAARAWSLSPEATVRGLYALMPGLACFAGALVLKGRARSKMAMLVVGLVLANLAFGLFQVGLPFNSALRLYDETSGSGFGGVFANGNHQATALVIGMLMAIGLAGRERRRGRETGSTSLPRSLVWIVVAGICLVAVPLSASSAGMLLAVIGCGVGAFATGLVSVRTLRRVRGGLFIAAGALVVMVIGSIVVLQWMDLKTVDAMRYQLAVEVFRLGGSYAPLGSGVGTFVDTFAQSASETFQRGEYVNHAHNEYAQWWLEAGWPAMALVCAALALIAVVGVRLLRARPRDPVAIACWLSVVAVLCHSSVDFPLRTTSLMSITALLAGLALSAAARSETRPAGARVSAVALPPA